MLKVLSSYFLLLSCSIHFFCCGIPFFFSIFSLTSSFGVSSLFFINEIWSEAYETPLYLLTTFIFFIFIISEIISRQFNCVEDGCCPKQICDKKQNLTKINLKISILFYSINTFVFLIEKY